MKMYINGKWVDNNQTAPVFNPYDQTVIDTVPKASAADVDLAITSAVRGAKAMGAMPSYERYLILRRAADLMSERSEDLGPDHHSGGGQGDRRRAGRGAAGYSDYHPVLGRGQAPSWRNGAIGCGSGQPEPVRVYNSSARGRGGGHRAFQFPPQPGLSQGGSGIGRRKLGGAKTRRGTPRCQR